MKKVYLYRVVYCLMWGVLFWDGFKVWQILESMTGGELLTCIGFLASICVLYNLKQKIK